VNTPKDPGSGSKVVLVVDDDADVLTLVESMLTDQGYEVVPASGAESAMQFFESTPRRPDLVLADVVMPGMSGPMLVDHLLSQDPDLRVLFMSGYDDRQVVQRYVVEKGFRLIPKPFTVKSLRTAIKEVLSTAPAGRAKGEPAS
jgi:two-component system cell cycle sensor histidine kinase/response regulator CckA